LTFQFRPVRTPNAESRKPEAEKKALRQSPPCGGNRTQGSFSDDDLLELFSFMERYEMERYENVRIVA